MSAGPAGGVSSLPPGYGSCRVVGIGLIISAPVFEEVFGRIGISREEYLETYDNDWICYYSRFLCQQGFDLTWYIFTRNVARPETRIHRPTGAAVRFLPSPWSYNWWTVRLPSVHHLSLHLATTSLALFHDLRDRTPDLLYVQDYESGRFDVVSLMAARLSVPVVGQFHGGHSPARWPLRGLRRWAVGRATCILSPNSEEHARVRRCYRLPPDRAHLFPNPVPVFPVADRPAGLVRESLGLSATDRYVMFLGRLDANKGVDVLLSAFRRLAGQYPDLHLVVAGTGPSLDALRRLADDLPRVHFLGWVASRQRVQELLGAAEVVACPSHQEAFCYAAAEAMVAMRPVVASAVGGVRDLVAGGTTGYLVPPGDAEALAQALRAVLAEPARAALMGRAGRERIEREFAESVLFPRLAELLRAAARRGGPVERASRPRACPWPGRRASRS